MRLLGAEDRVRPADERASWRNWLPSGASPARRDRRSFSERVIARLGPIFDTLRSRTRVRVRARHLQVGALVGAGAVGLAGATMLALYVAEDVPGIAPRQAVSSPAPALRPQVDGPARDAVPMVAPAPIPALPPAIEPSVPALPSVGVAPLPRAKPTVIVIRTPRPAHAASARRAPSPPRSAPRSEAVSATPDVAKVVRREPAIPRVTPDDADRGAPPAPVFSASAATPPVRPDVKGTQNAAPVRSRQRATARRDGVDAIRALRLR